MARKNMAVESAKMVTVDGVEMTVEAYDALLAAEAAAEGVTQLEPGLAKGLTPRETENALHAMGVEEKPVNPIREAAAAPKPRKTKTGGARFKADGSFGARAEHPGMFLMAVDGKHRKAGDPGAIGLEWLRDEYVVSFEDFAAKHPINHLNWDINRGWVKLISAEEAAEILGEDEGDEQPAEEAVAEQPAEQPAEEAAQE